MENAVEDDGRYSQRVSKSEMAKGPAKNGMECLSKYVCTVHPCNAITIFRRIKQNNSLASGTKSVDLTVVGNTPRVDK